MKIPPKKALVLVNVGTPAAAEKKEVRKFLRVFLNDKRVIDIPWVLRKILVNGIIIPFRINKSTKLYQQLFNEGVSPILQHLRELCNKVSKLVATQAEVYPAMRYGEPNLAALLKKLSGQNYSEIIIFPLFPQYASSTTGSVFDKVFSTLKNKQIIPPIRFIDQYYSHPAFIKSYAELIKKYKPESYDHIVFSYHGLPLRQIDKIHPHQNSINCNCTKEMPKQGHHCYKATSYHTTRLLMEALNLPKEKCSVGFQSRLDKNWLKPFTDRLLLSLLEKGNKKILICTPAFAADCLETIVEIEYEYKEMFKKAGGETLTMVSALNSTSQWAKAVSEIAFTEK